MSSNLTLLEFLAARLDEDERLAQRANGMRWDDDPADAPGESWVLNEDMHLFETDAQTAAFIARHDPDRVLRDVDAKRKIIAAYLPPSEDPHPGLPCTADAEDDPDGELFGGWDSGPCVRHLEATKSRFHHDYILRLLALPYAYRSDYQDAWKP